MPRIATQEQRVACDQCHRRKVKCDEGIPCEKCQSANLNCTRQLVRKRRGPKKGSGSVIAQLRSSHSNGLDSNGGSAPFDSGPFASFSDTKLPADDGFISSPTTRSFPGSPNITFSGLFPSSQPWTYGGPPPTRYNNGDQFLTVNELAQWILGDDEFLNATFPTSSPIITQHGNRIPSPPAIGRSYPPPTSIESLLAPTSTLPSRTYSSRYGPISTAASFPATIANQASFAPAMPFADDTSMTLAISTGMSANDGTIMSKCIDLHFQHMYPIMPVVHEPNFRRLVATPASLIPDDKALVLALCAVTIIHVSEPINLGWEIRKNLSQRFLHQFLQTRLTYDYTESSSLSTVISSYFVHTTLFEMKKFPSSWFYLREAVGMAQEIGLDNEDKYGCLNHIDLVAYRRTFALLFVTSRGASILRNKPLMIPKLRELPVGYFDNEEPTILTGFQCLCQLFSLLDEKFVEYWNIPQESALQPRASVDIAAAQRQLTSLEFEIAGLDDVQRADVLITQQWLRLVFWQAAMRQGLLSSNADDPAFAYRFPLDIARSMCDVLNRIPIEAVLVHGIGIFEKVFEVAYSLMDTLSLSKSSRASSIEDLKFLFRCLSASPASHETYVKVLVNKYNAQQSLPNASRAELLQSSGAPWVSTVRGGATPIITLTKRGHESIS